MRCYKEKLKQAFFLSLDIFSVFLLPFLLIYLLIRILNNKDEFKRLGEKFGFTKYAFKDKSKNIIWLHAASVGETIALFNITQKLLLNYNILFTTATLSSAQLVKEYFKDAITQNNLIHQSNILDIPWCLHLFLKRWPVKLAISCESEIWPIRILKLHKNHIAQIIVNATMSEKSFKHWQLLPTQFIFTKLNLVLCQNQLIMQKYRALGALKVKVTGNLKAESRPYIKDYELLAQAKQFKRKFLAAISTHAGEEKLILQIYKKLKSLDANLGLILVPRHIERIASIIKMIDEFDFSYMRKTCLTMEEFKNIDILLGDTIGDIGFFLELSYVAFIGKSIYEAQSGGHNPIEAIMMNVPVVSGDKIHNFKDIYASLERDKAVKLVKNEEELEHILYELTSHRALHVNLCKNAFKSLQQMQGAVNLTYKYLQQYLP